MKRFDIRHAPWVALIAGLSAGMMGCGAADADTQEEGDPVGSAAEAMTASGTLPGGTAIKVTIDNPANGATVPGGSLAVNGTAEIGVGLPIANTLLVYTLDVSGSTLLGGGCGGDQNGDGQANTRLDCEILATKTLNANAITAGTVGQVGVAVFGSSGAAADVGPATGIQLLTGPNTNANGNSTPDVAEVLSSAQSGRVEQFTSITVGDDMTNYGAGVTAALSDVAASSMANKLVVFVSDGLNNTGTPISTVLASPPPGVVFHTFAIGASASCTGGNAALGTLQEIANRTGGTCTNVPDVSSLPSVIPGVIASRLTALTLSVDGGPPIVPTITPPLPRTGPATVAFATVLPGLTAGSHTICATASGSDGGGAGHVTDCHTVLVNSPPVAKCKDITVPANQSCTGSGSVNNGSVDPDGDPLTCVQSPAGPYPLGTTTVTLVCTDSHNASSTCRATVRVVDQTPPSIMCPADQALECQSGGAMASFAPTASDNCGTPTVACVPPSGSTFPPGTTTDTCTATDAAGNKSSCNFKVNVKDSTPPVVTTTGTRISFWPPNHRFETFRLSDCVTSVTDSCQGRLDINAVGQITRITSDEAEDAGGGGDGNTCRDIAIVNATTASLRVERLGGSNGRVYTVYFTVRDSAGNATNSSCQAQVVHDQSPAHAMAVDSGCAFCVGSGCGSCPQHDPRCNR